jgi:predicted transcriptional regulator
MTVAGIQKKASELRGRLQELDQLRQRSERAMQQTLRQMVEVQAQIALLDELLAPPKKDKPNG